MANTSVFIPVITPVVTGAGLSGVGTVGDPLINTVTGPTIADTQVAYATGANTIGGDAGLTYDATAKALQVNGEPFLTGINDDNNNAEAALVVYSSRADGAGLVLADDFVDATHWGGLLLAYRNGNATISSQIDGSPSAATSLQILAGSMGIQIATPGALELGSGTQGIALATGAYLGNGKALMTDTTTGHTALIQAYDVNGTTYRTFATLTNGDVPSFAISQPSGGLLLISPPTTDPHVSGAIWNNTGLVVVSTG